MDKEYWKQELEVVEELAKELKVPVEGRLKFSVEMLILDRLDTIATALHGRDPIQTDEV